MNDQILTKFIYMTKYPSKYQLVINGKEKVGIKKLKNPKAFIDYFHEYLGDYNPNKEEKRVNSL